MQVAVIDSSFKEDKQFSFDKNGLRSFRRVAEINNLSYSDNVIITVYAKLINT